MKNLDDKILYGMLLAGLSSYFFIKVVINIKIYF